MQLCCEERGVVSDEVASGWRMYSETDDETDEPFVAAYCPECVEREFGSS